MEAPATRSTHSFHFLSAIFLITLFFAVWTNEYFLLVVPFIFLVLYSGWLHPNFAFFLLLLTLPFSFEYNFTPSLGTDVPDEGLMLIVSLLFMGVWIYRPAAVTRKIILHPLVLLLAFHVGWILVSTLTSTYSLISLKYLLAKSWYLGAFVLAPLLVFNNKKLIRISAIILAVSILIVSSIAIIRHAVYGFSFASANRSVAPFFRNHVSYSSMLVCLLPLFFSFFVISKERKIRSWLVVAIMILLVALFFSYARGAWLALFAGVLSYWLIRKRWLFSSYLLMIAIAISLIFWLKNDDRYLHYAHDYQTTIYHEDFGQHLVATYELKDVSTAERFYRWIAGVRMIKDRPLTGFGPATFYENYKPYGIPAFKTWVSDNPEKSTVHNYFLLLIIEQGFPGLVFFLLLLGAMIYYAQHLYHRTTDQFYKTAAITTGVILVMITTVNLLSDLIETDKIGSLFFLCLSALIMIDVNSRNQLKSASHV